MDIEPTLDVILMHNVRSITTRLYKKNMNLDTFEKIFNKKATYQNKIVGLGNLCKH